LPWRRLHETRQTALGTPVDPLNISTPNLSLPKGGGAIRGLDPSFAAAGFRGTAQLTIPLAIPQARALTPMLSLTYDSGGGNGPCGIGAAIALPAVSRSTAAGVPTYRGTDTIVFSETGPLIAKGEWQNGRWNPDERIVRDTQGVLWKVQAFVPRLEGGLPLIEQWTRLEDRTSSWRIISADNVVSRFGVSAEARIGNPDDPAQTLVWLIEDVADAKGNVAQYVYKAEDNANDPTPRLDLSANKYVERIRYGNYIDRANAAFAFEIVFDYGEYSLDNVDQPGADPYQPVRAWPMRLDPFSNYRGGFELRTNRLCCGVLAFHRFPAELGPEPCLTRAVRFDYAQSPFASCLTGVTELGYQRQSDGSYRAAALPPVSLSWSTFDPPPAPEFRRIEVDAAADLPGYLAPASYQPVDLDGEGLPGFLESNAAGTRYYAPLGEGRYAAPQPQDPFPNCRDFANPQLALVDLDANGRLALLVSGNATSGYFRHGDDGSWSGFEPFERAPTVQQSTSLELVDLTGNGMADLMQLRATEVQYYLSRGTEGYAAQRSAGRQPDFPSAAANSGREFVTFADIFGDGLAHRVRISDGEVAVWPNLGHGKFGKKVQLANAPRFATTLSPSRLYFADVDGTGCADLVIAETGRLLIYRNQSGNGFAAPLSVDLPFRFGDNDQLSFADILGNATTAIVATCVLPAVEHWFCDLASPAGQAGNKPYLLTKVANGFGGTTQISYASSTSFYLADKRDGRPWLTRLPFPVQVVERTVTTDEVTGAQSTQRFRYHDGYFDPEARSFRGFGYVESWQTQSFQPFQPSPQNPHWPVARVNTDLRVAPTYARTWYCTGAYFLSAALAAQYAEEYFAGDSLAYHLPPSVFDPAVLAAGGPTLQQAYAALAGKALHSEIYAEDGPPTIAGTPYTVSEANYTVLLAQAAGPQGFASFVVRERESILYTYERDAEDPRFQHAFLLVSTLLDPARAKTFYERRCTVFYGRRPDQALAAYSEQTVLKASVEESWSTRVLAPFRMVGVSYDRRSSEIGGLTPPASGIFSFAEIERQVATALGTQIAYGQPFTPGVLEARLATESQSYFWNDNQDAALPLGEIAPRALLHHEQSAVFSESWLTTIFAVKVSDSDVTNVAGYVPDGVGYWWNPGLVQSYFPPSQPDLFFLPRETASPATAPGLFQKTTVRYDAPYALFAIEVDDFVDLATALSTSAVIDYQALQPAAITDPNGIVQQALYGPLGLVLVTSIFKPASGGNPRIGDGNLSQYAVRTDATFAAVLANPAYYLEDASSYFFYDLLSWVAPTPQPISSITLLRTRFVSDGVADAPVETSIVYSDGTGQALESKQACEPASGEVAARWLVSGRTVRDAQAHAVQVYFPFYAPAAAYEGQQALVDQALAPPPRIDLYDPLGRVIKVATPKGFFSRTVFGAWQTLSYDEDDTVLDAPFYIDFMEHYPPNPTQQQQDEKAALDKAAKFYNTPSTAVLDNAAHTIRQIQNNLGNVQLDAFTAIVAGTEITSAQLWSALIAADYLETATVPAGTWVTSAFQPYSPGFSLALPPPYDQFASAVTTLLMQSDLTNFFAVDLAGRVLEAIDPRLFLADVQSGGDVYNFRYAYPMGSEQAARSDSADAGTRWMLASFLDTPVLAFDAMGRRQQKTFDGLERLAATVVTETDGSQRTTEILTYGESRPEAAAANLLGQLYELQDEAGIALYPSYTILGQPAASSRQFAQDYKTPIDWSHAVALDPQLFATAFTYDELRRPLTETEPDSSVIAWQYSVSGRVQSIDVTPAGGTAQPFITGVGYGADNQRTSIAYGNGVTQALGYEVTTERLVTLSATRPATRAGGVPQDPTLQTVDYTYDPVGNVSLLRDRTAQLLFCCGTEPEALGDYVYDALYRSLSATGLQHPGIEASTYVTGFMQSLYAELCPPGSAPVALETYSETYSYDNSGNLTQLRHAAASASFERDNPVVATSNQLAGVPYDANGNTLQTTLTAPVALIWDARNNLAATGPLEKPDGSYEQDYLVYDFSGQRARRIVEASATVSGPVTETREQITLGAYVLTRTTGASGTVTSVTTLRVQDGTSCFVVTNSSGGGEIRYQLDDRLGSVSVEVGQDTGILSYEAFFPFGGTSIIAGSDPAVVARKLLRYSGKECDDSTGFYYYGARYYVPWQSRWLNPDPSGAVDGMNLMQFVGDNPLTLIDPDGRGGDDPKKPASNSYRKLIEASLRSYMYTIFSAPRNAYIDAPSAIAKRFSFDPAVRAQSRAAARARLEESKILYYSLALGFGIDPKQYLHPALISLIEPKSWPSSTYFGSWGLQGQLKSKVSQPEFLASYAGSMLGNFTTVGTSLAVLRTLLLSAAPLPIKILGSPLIGGLALGAIGRGEETERVYAQFEESQKKIWFWSKDYTPWLSGIPRTLVYTGYQERETQKLWAGFSIEEAFATAAGLVILRFAAPPLTAWAKQRAWQWWRASWGPGGWRGGGGTAPNSTALVLWQPKPLAIVRKQPPALPAVVQPRVTAIVPFKEPVRAVVPYRPRPSALQRVQPSTNALTLFRRLPSSLVPVITPPRRGANPRSFAAVIPVVVGLSALAFLQQNRRKSNGK
jgi:RHS repeat-associated protein